MVFASMPSYLDPANWQQQPNHQSASTGANAQLQLPPPPQLPPSSSQPNHVANPASIRPGSMSDRARMANMPLPDAALKCPRCDSTNTKFCYFNNYSLSQPRHFCKTCRRYWTRGGALRNVPVGGGCRRNKRSKGSTSKGPASGDNQAGSSTSTATPTNSSGSGDILGLGPQIHQPLRFMSQFHQLSDFGIAEIGINYSGLSVSQPVASSGDFNFLLGSTSGSGNGVGANSGVVTQSSGGGLEQWRIPQIQQFPFLASLDSSPGLHPLEGGSEHLSYLGGMGQVHPKVSGPGASQLASVKFEGNQNSNLSRQFAGFPGNDQYWNGSTTAWTDLSGFNNSSSTSHPL